MDEGLAHLADGSSGGQYHEKKTRPSSTAWAADTMHSEMPDTAKRKTLQ